mgnify:CR=1 FL=1
MERYKLDPNTFINLIIDNYEKVNEKYVLNGDIDVMKNIIKIIVFKIVDEVKINTQSVKTLRSDILMLIDRENTIAFSGTPIVYPFKKNIIKSKMIEDKNIIGSKMIEDRTFLISDFIRELIAIDIECYKFET